MKEANIRPYRTFLLLGIFAVAMGFLEAIVVVYLRQIYYPHGFDFPLILLSPQMLSVEWVRETATLVMLASVGIIAGRTNLQRLLFFLYSFAVWDIFYYIALMIFLGWPASLLTWDILFLIPVPWIAPVLAPVICSLTMIIMAGLFIGLEEKGYPVKMRPFEWVLIYLGAFIIFCTYIRDYTVLIINSGLLSGSRDTEEKEQFWKIITHYNPTHYDWLIFITGELIILCALIFAYRRIKTGKTNENKSEPQP